MSGNAGRQSGQLNVITSATDEKKACIEHTEVLWHVQSQPASILTQPTNPPQAMRVDAVAESYLKLGGICCFDL
jgi:hypothetical protein